MPGTNPDSVPPITESEWTKLDDAAREDYLRRFHEISYERDQRLVHGQRGIAKTQGELAAGQASLLHKVNGQRFELRAIAKIVDAQAKKLDHNTAATERTEKKIDELTANTQALVDLYRNASVVGSAITWSAEWGKRLAWVLVPLAFVSGAGVTSWAWIKGIWR